MKDSEIDAKASHSSIKNALLVLSGVGAASFGLISPANAQAVAGKPAAMDAAPTVSIDKVAKPKNVVVKTPQTWQRVVIDLTPEQKEQLSKMGVKTNQLKITTYNIQNLAAQMIN